MITWLYTVIDNESVRVRYDLRRNVIDWRTLEPYTEPPLRTYVGKFHTQHKAHKPETRKRLQTLRRVRAYRARRLAQTRKGA